MSDELTEQQRTEVQAENLKAYIAGVFDVSGNVYGTVKTSQEGRFGYHISVLVRIESREVPTIMLIEDWAHDHGLNPNIVERDREGGPSYRLVFGRRDDIKQLLSMLSPYILSKADEARLMLDEILPRLEAGDHRTKEGFVEIVSKLDELGSTSRKKYDADFFRDEWADDLDG